MIRLLYFKVLVDITFVLGMHASWMGRYLICLNQVLSYRYHVVVSARENDRLASLTRVVSWARVTETDYL
jgi:hypothetical protein